MFNWIDILGILVLIISGIISFKKGFIKTFFGFISTFVAIVLAFMLCNAGVEILKNTTQIDEWLTETLSSTLDFGDGEDEEDVQITDTNENMLLDVLKNLPENIQNSVGLEEYKVGAKEVIINNSVEIILKIFSWIIIYLLVRAILAIVCIVFNGIMQIPFLKQINNMAGLILGVLLGLFRIYVFLAFISFIITFIPSINPFVEAIKSSMIIGLMYENNILISLIF